jgi:hypothetical protein
MTLRKQFESFAMEKLVVSRGDLLQTDSGKRYRCVDIEQAWEIFQAGHAASGRDELLGVLQVVLNDLVCEGLPEHKIELAEKVLRKARGEAMSWIHITERLPDINQIVMFTCYQDDRDCFSEVDIGQYIGGKTMGNAIAIETCGDDWSPCTHWMPLPELPEVPT